MQQRKYTEIFIEKIFQSTEQAASSLSFVLTVQHFSAWWPQAAVESKDG